MEIQHSRDCLVASTPCLPQARDNIDLKANYLNVSAWSFPFLTNFSGQAVASSTKSMAPE
jgi:hypothetical protein